MPAKRNNFIKFSFILILVFIALAICIKNFSPRTFLIGWDSLHPEFNFPVAFRRVLDGVFRGEQGLGAVAAHSHMSDFPRLIFIWLLSFVAPLSFLRYSYIFLCLILGTVGMFLFLEYVFRKEKESLWIFWAAFLGALSYLLNLGTLQTFYVPFEMFPAAFAFTPWLFLIGLKFLREGTKKNLLFWVLVVIISSPMAYAATLWYAVLSGIFIFFLAFAVVSSSKVLKIKRFFTLFILAIFLNSYWILPNIYSIFDQSKVIASANTNRLFSPEAFLRNRDYGDFKDILLQKNFLFFWRNFDFSSNSFVDLLGVWNKYLLNPVVTDVGLAIAGLSILGFLVMLIKREKVGVAMVPALFFCLFFLVNINPPTGNFYGYLYNHFQVFAEGFRTPFTKFSTLYSFFASFYLGYFAFIFLSLKNKFLAFFKLLFSLGISLMIVYFMLPVFSGNLIGANVRRQFPEEYFQLFNWFNSQGRGTIALFPINSKYGWEYRNWGYEGSGFLTYGISNPILYRDFDRWNSANEDFYNQASFALYNGNDAAFINTLKKYQVKYLLLDESIVNPGGSPDILQIPHLKSIFENSNQIERVANFGFLTVYKTNFDNSNNDLKIVSKFTQIDPNLSYSPIDIFYQNVGDYVNLDPAVYPFANLDQRSGVKITVDGSSLSFLNQKTGSLLKMPILNPIYENLGVNRGFANAFNCDLEKTGSVSKENSAKGILYSASMGGASCDFLSYPLFNYNQAYVLRVAGQNSSGRSLKIYLFNETSNVPDLEEILPLDSSGNFDQTYFVYPKNVNGGGYVLNFETRSFGRIPSENLLTKVEFYPVDFNVLENYVLGPVIQNSNNLRITSEVKLVGVMYKIDVQNKGLIQLSKGYDDGWVAVSSNFQNLRHVKINSWANGWVIPEGVNRIYIIFWPQLLEWGGMALAALTLLVFSLKRRWG